MTVESDCQAAEAMSLLTGDELRRIFNYYKPFTDDGKLKPAEERVTILAANANTPLDLFARAMIMAAAQGQQTPLIVQLSQNALAMAGGEEAALPPIEGVRRQPRPHSSLEGARIVHRLLEAYSEHYGADLVAMSLDHFRVPRFEAGQYTGVTSVTAEPAPGVGGGHLDRELARTRLEDAAVYMEPVFGSEARVDDDTREAYINYLCSPQYRRFKGEFLAIVSEIWPAWGMVDTEKLPPLLDFVVTREVVEAVRSELGNHDMVVEAEFGATGTRGQALPYQALAGRQLDLFAEKVALFLQYTGAEGIAYPIGMEHAAKINDKHEPDVRRLEVVQARILDRTGRYVPFAQHGGTGAASLARGLVGKNNVNTKFLVTAANFMADHVQAHLEGIRAGDKEDVGSRIYQGIIHSVAGAAIEKMEETGTYQQGQELRRFLWPEGRRKEPMEPIIGWARESAEVSLE